MPQLSCVANDGPSMDESDDDAPPRLTPIHIEHVCYNILLP